MAEKWLVVDDSATIQRVIKLAFQNYDVAITEAESCQEAIKELTRAMPQLIIVDAALAGAQSVSDFAALQKYAPDTPFVILGGSYDHINESQFRAAGFKYFLKKPFDAAQLVGISKQALGHEIPLRGEFQRENFANTGFGHTAAGMMTMSVEHTQNKAPPPVPMMRNEDYQVDDETTSGSFDLGLRDKAPRPDAGVFGHDELTRKLNYSNLERKPLLTLEDESAQMPSEESPPPLDSHHSFNRSSGLPSLLEPMLQHEMEALVRSAVEEYCEKNFAGLARELILRELEKLTQERSRLLVDK